MVNEILGKIPVYGTRQMVHELMDPYTKGLGIKPCVLRNMMEFLKPNFHVPHDHASDSKLDKRLAKFILDSGDTELAYDLRVNNGKVRNAAFDPFWAELQQYLDAII